MRLLLCAAELIAALTAALGATQFIPNAIAGPFRIVPGHLGTCPPDLRPAKKHYVYKYVGQRDRKDPDVWIYSANVTTFTTLNDNYTYTHTVDSWKARGGWAPNAFVFKFDKPFTVARTQFPQYWRTAMEILFNDPNRDQPFLPCSVAFTNLSTNFDITMPPAFYYGKYRVTAWMRNARSGELVGCERAYCEVKPKLRKPNRSAAGSP